MQDQRPSGTSADNTIWIWIILAGLLILAALLAIGSLAVINWNQQLQLPTGSQSTPAR
jgi:hypothetical protein